MWTEVTSHDKVLIKQIFDPFSFGKTRNFLSFFTYSYLLLSKWDFWNVIVSILRLWFSCLINKGLLYFLSLLSEGECTWFIHDVHRELAVSASTADFLNLTLGWSRNYMYLAKVVISTFMVCWFYWAHSYTSWIISPTFFILFYFESNSPSPFQVDIHWHSPNGFLCFSLELKHWQGIASNWKFQLKLVYGIWKRGSNSL